MHALIRGLFRDLQTPSTEEETLYSRLVIGIAHALVGAAVVSLCRGLVPLDPESLLALRLAIPVWYWLVKELADWLRRGGRFADGIEDASWVGLGGLYPGLFGGRP